MAERTFDRTTLACSLKKESDWMSDRRMEEFLARAVLRIVRLTWMFWCLSSGLTMRTTLGTRLERLSFLQHQDAPVHGDVLDDEVHDVVEELVERESGR